MASLLSSSFAGDPLLTRIAAGSPDRISKTHYLSMWLLFGVAALTASAAMTPIESTVLVVAMLSIAAGWRLTRWKRRVLISHARPALLPPCGFAADRACLRLGTRYGARCVRRCWPYMAIMAVVGHGLSWMIALSALRLVEARTAVLDSARRWIACGLSITAAVVAYPLLT